MMEWGLFIPSELKDASAELLTLIENKYKAQYEQIVSIHSS